MSELRHTSATVFTKESNSMNADVLWEKIRFCWKSVAEQVRFRDHGDYLMSKGAFSFDDFERLNNMHGKAQTNEMLLTMRRKSPESVLDFMDSLRRECAHVAREIEDKILDRPKEPARNPHSSAATATTDQADATLNEQIQDLLGEMEKMTISRKALESHVKDLEAELDIKDAAISTLECEIKKLKSLPDGVVFPKLKLPEGWQNDIVVRKVKSTMNEKMEEEVMPLTKKVVCRQAAINTLRDLSTIATCISATFNDRHGKCWHCVAGQAGTFDYCLSPKKDTFIALDVELASVSKSLSVMLLKAARNKWSYPLGWRDNIKVEIVGSDLPESICEEAKQLVLGSIKRQLHVHTVSDMNSIVRFVRDTWVKTHAGQWQVMTGERSRYGGSVSDSYIQLDVDLTATKKEMTFLLFNTEQ